MTTTTPLQAATKGDATEAETYECHERVRAWWLRDAMRSPEGDEYRRRRRAERGEG